MKINPSATRTVTPSTVSRNESGLSQAYGSAKEGSAGSSQVALSGASRQLLALQDGSNDINVERVAAIRAAIASGQLKIDPTRIADSLIASAKELLK